MTAVAADLQSSETADNKSHRTQKPAAAGREIHLRPGSDPEAILSSPEKS